MAICTLEEFGRSIGAKSPGDIRRLVKILENRQVLNCARQMARLNRANGRPNNEALPLRENGEDFGRVEARIPATMFMQLMQQKNFGYEGLTSDDGMKDLLRDFPQCRVKTVSGRVTVAGGFAGRKVVRKY